MGIDENIFSEATPLVEYDRELDLLYAEYGISVDSLIVSDVFELFRLELERHGYDKSKEEIALRLLNLRKAGRLSVLGRVDSKERIQHILTATGITTVANTAIKSDQLQEIINRYVHDANLVSVVIHKNITGDTFDIIVKHISK